MLAASGKRYFLDKTPAYALILPFLTRLYPDARYVVLTRHPLAIASSYANSFFAGDWHAATDFNPIVNRYVPAVARLLRNPPQRLLQVGYEKLVRDPQPELARLFAFLDLENEPRAVEYGRHYAPARQGLGDPITVDENSRPVETSIDKWVTELANDPRKLELASEIVATLDAEDVQLWGFDKAQLLTPVDAAQASGVTGTYTTPRTNNYLLQRRIMLLLKKDIQKRAHGKVVEKVRYYCNVLLRE
jgi:hypothetical protein